MTTLLTADEAARLVPGERLVIVRAGDVCADGYSPGGASPRSFVAPQDWVALTGRCPNTHLVEDQQLGGCRDCINRKPIVELRTACVVCDGHGFVEQSKRASRSDSHWCRVCWDAKQLKSIGSVLVCVGSIEVVPVVKESPPHEVRRFVTQWGNGTEWLLINRDSPSGEQVTQLGVLDPLPVPGRDFGIVIDCVEVSR